MAIFTIFLVLGVVVQRSANTFILHTAGEKVKYSGAAAILMSELIKQAICWALAVNEAYRGNEIQTQNEYISIPSTAKNDEKHLTYSQGSDSEDDSSSSSSVHESSLPQPYDMQHQKSFSENIFRAIESVKEKTFTKKAFLLSIPAGLFVVQNNLIFFAVPRMEPSLFQAAWQIRLLPTAYLSQLILKKNISRNRWMCLFGVLVGVSILESSELLKKEEIIQKFNGGIMASTPMLAGTAALMIAAMLSAFASVLLEKIYVTKGTSLWVANFQLGLFSIVPALFLISFECFSAGSLWAPFDSLMHSVWPWYAILAQASVGILVALVTKWTGSVGNGLAGIGSIALTSCISLIFPSEDSTTSSSKIVMVLGIMLTILCTQLYSNYSLKEQKVADSLDVKNDESERK